ncbi:hypothetical protein [Ralstonia sp. UBA689]|uniref:hypothetical protein n=1 Tax=Ralstonia sp. UBA689 TaxID=1947373 RepID=UPI0025F4EE54|nr:hypothetical protein [Ralstonia sp. UBA689]
MNHATRKLAHNRPHAAAAMRSLCAGLLLAGSASAQPVQNETLMVAAPDGYTIANSGRRNNAEVTQMVPSGQNVNDWTEMVTVQIYPDVNAFTFNTYAAGLEERFKAACESAEAHALKRAEKNGYDTEYWELNCQVKDGAHTPSVTWFKMLRGNDRLYVVLKAFLMEPSKEQIKTTAQYLKNISVCDTRLKDRPCVAR